MKKYNRLLNSRGESLIELLIATFIIGITLTVVISVFLSGRAGIVSSWDRTEKNLCASYIMEQLKITEYETLKGFSGSGWNDFSATTLAVDEQYSTYQIQFNLSPYETYSVDELIQANVRVRNGGDGSWVEKASLIRKGDST